MKINFTCETNFHFTYGTETIHIRNIFFVCEVACEIFAMERINVDVKKRNFKFSRYNIVKKLNKEGSKRISRLCFPLSFQSPLKMEEIFKQATKSSTGLPQLSSKYFKKLESWKMELEENDERTTLSTLAPREGSVENWFRQHQQISQHLPKQH